MLPAPLDIPAPITRFIPVRVPIIQVLVGPCDIREYLWILKKLQKIIFSRNIGHNEDDVDKIKLYQLL